jgi:hypothetical protein
MIENDLVGGTGEFSVRRECNRCETITRVESSTAPNACRAPSQASARHDNLSEITAMSFPRTTSHSQRLGYSSVAGNSDDQSYPEPGIDEGVAERLEVQQFSMDSR